jgi:uncharacterized membrane protein YhaH (DUF805 family)
MFKNPFSFEGRIRRLEHGLSWLLCYLYSTIANFILLGMWPMDRIFNPIKRGDARLPDNLVDISILVATYIPFFWFAIAQNTKRCHDVGKNGSWQLVPFYGVYLLAADGVIGDNEYGKNPKGLNGEFDNKSEEPEVIASNKEAPFHMENLSQLLDSEDINGSIIEIDDFINSCHYGDNLEGLSLPQQKFLFNQNLERQVNNGGFWQFFMNSSGDYAHETVHSLQEIEAIETADIVQQAIDLFPGSNVPKEWSERQKLVEKIDPEKMLWEELDQRFMTYEEDLNELNIKFVAKHNSSF